MKKTSILLPIMDEVESLKKTIDIILQENKEHKFEFIFILSKKSKKESLALAQLYVKENPLLFKLVIQGLPMLGGALQDGISQATGSSILIMASDLETDPHSVKDLLNCAQKNPNALITASRWLEKKSFSGYHPIKIVANLVFQKFFSCLYEVKLSDLSFGFRILPASYAKNTRWTEHSHAFLFETLVRAIKQGIEIKEISSTWQAREEGESHNLVSSYFAYFRVGLKVKFFG